MNFLGLPEENTEPMTDEQRAVLTPDALPEKTEESAETRKRPVWRVPHGAFRFSFEKTRRVAGQRKQSITKGP